MNSRCTDKRGSALIAALVYLAVVTAFATAFITAIDRGMDIQHTAERHMICRNLAQGGVDLAIAELGKDPGYSGTRAMPLGEGEITVRVTRDAEGAYSIASTGQLRDGAMIRARYSARAKVRLTENGAVEGLQWVDSTP